MNNYMPLLPAGEVHIWLARQPTNPDREFESVLTLDERSRAQQFRFPEQRAAYVFAHAALRYVLSRYARCRPGDIRFIRNAFGKPFLYGGAQGSELEFNLSHTGQLVLIGVSRRRIGVDVEEIRSMHDDIVAIAESYFTPQECAYILRQDTSDRLYAFLRCWTRKEAYVKSVGAGLSIPLNSFDTLPSSERSGVFSSDASAAYRTKWKILDLEVVGGYMAAVAIEGACDRLVEFHWPTNCNDADGASVARCRPGSQTARSLRLKTG